VVWQKEVSISEYNLMNSVSLSQFCGIYDTGWQKKNTHVQKWMDLLELLILSSKVAIKFVFCPPALNEFKGLITILE
jgi:hypothetical protein